jgi:hypothetical protein
MAKIKKGKQKAVEEPPVPKLEEVVEVTEEDDDDFGGLGKYLTSRSSFLSSVSPLVPPSRCHTCIQINI